MSFSRVVARPVPARAQQTSTRFAFFVAGFGMAGWAPLVPFVKSRADLSEGALGLLMLCLGMGSIAAMPLAGAMAGRFGCRRAMVFDCAVNIQAVMVERAAERPMMSGFHGLLSVGGIAAASGVTAALSLGASPLVASLIVVAVLVVAMAAAFPGMLRYGREGGGSAFALPRGMVLFIGLLCFVAFLTEGAALDWSAVFLTTVRGLPASYAGLGYAAFAATMTVGRLTGDAMVRHLGRRRVVVGGGLCAAAGLVLAALIPAWPAAILGFALVGAGCSNIVPVLYNAVGRQARMPEHVAVPAITTLGYAGILAGPAAIGFVAHATSLPVALLGVALLLLGVAASGRLLRV